MFYLQLNGRQSNSSDNWISSNIIDNQSAWPFENTTQDNEQLFLDFHIIGVRWQFKSYLCICYRCR
jgi:hypothetical protein